MGLEAICWSATSPSTIIFIRRWGIRFCNCEKKKSWLSNCFRLLLLWKMTTKEKQLLERRRMKLRRKRRSKVLLLLLVSTDLITTERRGRKRRRGRKGLLFLPLLLLLLCFWSTESAFSFTFNFSLKWSYWCPFLKLKPKLLLLLLYYIQLQKAQQYSLRASEASSPFLSSSLMLCYKTRRALNLITAKQTLDMS